MNKEFFVKVESVVINPDAKHLVIARSLDGYQWPNYDVLEETRGKIEDAFAKLGCANVAVLFADGFSLEVLEMCTERPVPDRNTNHLESAYKEYADALAMEASSERPAPDRTPYANTK